MQIRRAKKPKDYFATLDETPYYSKLQETVKMEEEK